MPILFLTAWLACPLITWAAMLGLKRRMSLGVVWVVCLTSVIVGVVLLANYVWALDAELLAEVDKYEPGTPEAHRAGEEWASDTDRSFLLVSSPMLTAVWYGAVYLLLFGLRRVVRRMQLTAI
ncbi:MAG: hypothetical protein O3A37_10825 [Planctomycetota bacterium]|nr:hypothetical protein [Planctomycetota bacterium]